MEKDVKEFSTATEKLIQVDIEKEMRESFLQYSMAVLVSRALPDVRDGMKPVHRRIIYTMNEADNTSSKPYRKCMIGTGAMSDPYIPLEKELKLTRRCLEIINRYGFGVTVQTKSASVMRDIDLFTKQHCIP